MPEPMELAYEERGSGPLAVFVHGFPLDGTMWTGQLAGLSKVRTVAAVHLRADRSQPLRDGLFAFAFDRCHFDRSPGGAIPRIIRQDGDARQTAL